jgi:hypothetical protein
MNNPLAEEEIDARAEHISRFGRKYAKYFHGS